MKRSFSLLPAALMLALCLASCAPIGPAAIAAILGASGGGGGGGGGGAPPPLEPVADFSVSPSEGGTSTVFSFTDVSTGMITSWSWDFGAGASPATASTQGPHSVTYSTTGVKTISLTVTGPGGSDIETKTNHITIYAVPVADLTGIPLDGGTTTNFSFTDTSTGTITSWSWDFGADATPANASTQGPHSVTYSTTGTKTISLTVTGPGGSDPETKPGYITVHAPPIADFTGTPLEGGTTTNFSFTDASTGTVTSWLWDFGAGASPATANTQGPHSVTYSTAGPKTVSLTVTGPGGTDPETKANYITVYAAPVADFTASPTSGASPLLVSFTNTSTGGITSCEWDFNNDSVVDATMQDATWIYSDYGISTVRLRVTGPGGWDEEIKVSYITVYEPPVADFTATPVSGTSPLPVSFTNTSTGTIASYSWDFGDTGTSTVQSPDYTYNTPGIYNVSFTVTGPGGSDTETKTDYITVLFPPFSTIYVATTGNDLTGDGSLLNPYETIQKGLDSVSTGCTVLVADGTYTGAGNKNLDFNGKDICLKSLSGAASCIIDCQDDGRGFYFYSGETNAAIVEGFTITNGNLGSYGGGVCCWDTSSPTFTNCTISGNTATSGYGGGVYCQDSSNPAFTNCIISGNTAGSDDGGGVYCNNSSPAFTNCTISGNTAGNDGGGIHCSSDSDPVLNNTIVWGNSASSGNQIYTDDGASSVTLNYCDYADDSLDPNNIAGAGSVNDPLTSCIHLDPEFVNATAQDYHLLGTSPCINAGDNGLIPGGVTTDLDGNPRIASNIVDIGAYECRTWREKFPLDSPSARDDHTMVFDSANEVIVLFGGYDGATCSDTWQWDGNNWNDVSPGGIEGTNYPTGRGLHAMAYDSSRGITVLFGGYTGGTYLEDTWEWNGTSWSNVSPGGTPGVHFPSARGEHAMAYDPSPGIILLFGGYNGISGNDETWKWDGVSWTQLSPAHKPPATGTHAMVYDSKRDIIVLFGGVDGTTYLNDTWEWNGTDWTQVFPANKPGIREHHDMVYDSIQGVMILFGGYYWDGMDSHFYDDTWIWDGINWTQRFPTDKPSARTRLGMAYDSKRGVVVLFGGVNITLHDDTWEW